MPQTLRLRDITPRGFYARSLMIVLLPLVILLAGMTWFFYDSHIAEVSRKLSQTIAGDVALVREIMTDTEDPRDTETRREQIARTLRLDVRKLEDTSLPEAPARPFWTRRDSILRHELRVALGDIPFWFDTNARNSQVRILIDDPQGMFQILVDRKRTFVTTGHIFIVWVVIFSLFLVLITIGFLRNQVKSVLKLAAAAEAWGRGEDIGELKPTGATEVRQAANAIAQMRNRIIAHADQRTAMLAGVSHDLRTPLTRLKLQLALLPESEDKAAARKDISEMEGMLNAYLAFARGEEGEAYQDVNIADMVQDIALEVADRVEVNVTNNGSSQVRVRPLAVKRALANLIHNAAHHAGQIDITIRQSETSLDVTIGDNGPGIAENLYEEAFKPFSRLDAARNQNKAGVGLGMALARDIARSHGGDVQLGKAPQGGLLAIFHLPRQVVGLDVLITDH